MTAGAPWSVKGIDPKAREIAKDLARRSGMTLGEWLNQMIMEDGEAGADTAAEAETSPLAAAELARVGEALDTLSRRIEDAETRSTLAVSGISQSVTGLLSRLDGAERNQTAVAARMDGALDEIRDEQTRQAERLARVEEETSAPKALEAFRALEAAVGKVATHAYDAESRTRQDIGGLRGELDALADKVGRLDAARADPAATEALAARIVERLDEAERRTSTAIGALETAFADLDQRLRNAELRNDVPEERLERLAGELARNFSEARAELAERLRDTSGGRLEAIERSLQQMTGHVADAERRSAQAIEKMGHEVLRMAENLGRRMEGVEYRGAKAIEQVSGDVARIADTVEQRFRRADALQAESLEKLGGEIAKITERLADRIANAERRSAQAIDDVGEQVSRVTERLNERQERASADIADRIRQSEERTAKLLEEAREKIDQRLAEAQRRLGEPAPARGYAAPIDDDFYADPGADPFGRDAFPAPSGQRGGQPQTFADAAFDAPFHDESEVFGEPTAARLAAATAETESFGAFDNAAKGDEAFGDSGFDATFDAGAFDQSGFGQDGFGSADTPQEESFGGFEPEPTAGGGSTRDLIEQARAAARAAQGSGGKDDGKGNGSLFSTFTFGKKKKAKQSSSVKTALMMSATAAALGISAFGFTLINAQWVGGAKRQPPPGLDVAADDGDASEDAGGPPLAALAVGPNVALPPGLVEPASAPEMARSNEAAALYASAVRRIEAKDFSAVADLRRAANLGDSQAQFYLAKLYEGGEAGLKKDMTEARRWTERAAQNGERRAMHNLALYYFEGVGGAKNATAAAQWFRRAADLGLTDSQYNLARLYQEGLGVGQNPAEAYKWYLIAGRAGDGEAKAAGDRLRAKLSAQAVAAAQKAATAFRPDAPAQMAAAAAPGDADLAAAQKALARLGYYDGPLDGRSSPALRMAIAAFQKDNSLTQTGVVDPALAQRFASIAR